MSYHFSGLTKISLLALKKNKYHCTEDQVPPSPSSGGSLSHLGACCSIPGPFFMLDISYFHRIEINSYNFCSQILVGSPGAIRINLILHLKWGDRSFSSQLFFQLAGEEKRFHNLNHHPPTPTSSFHSISFMWISIVTDMLFYKLMNNSAQYFRRNPASKRRFIDSYDLTLLY